MIDAGRLVLAGRKTQTRRLAIHRRGLTPPRHGLTEGQWLRCTTHHIGRVYPLERYARGDELLPEQRMRLEAGSRQKPPALTIAHVRCVDLRLQRLGDVDLKDARAEGFRTTDEFRAAWVQARDMHRLLMDDDDANYLLRLFDRCHAHRLVWAFTFEIIETPRLLKATSSYDDYTDKPSKAARAEPEALTVDQLAALTRYAPAKDHAQRRQPVATHAHNIARELDELTRRLPEEGIVDRDLKRTVRQMSHQAERLKDKLNA